jgi:hypothetical protein
MRINFPFSNEKATNEEDAGHDRATPASLDMMPTSLYRSSHPYLSVLLYAHR